MDANEHAAVEASLEKVGKLRDRFALLGSVLAVACSLAAVWVRAPTLEVELPLGAEAKASFNVGYVLAMGIPAITVAYAWISGALVSMRRYQLEVVTYLIQSGRRDRDLLLERVAGSLRAPAGGVKIDRAAAWITIGARVLILFIIPSAACVWIAIAYFSSLEIYPEHNLTPCWAIKAAGPTPSPATECRHDVTVGEQFLGLTLAKWLLGTPGGHKDDRYAVANGDFERTCEEVWQREDQQGRARTSGLNLAEGRPGIVGDAGEKCVLDEFPRIILPATSWLNLSCLMITVVLGVFGFRVHATLPTLQSIRTDSQGGSEMLRMELGRQYRFTLVSGGTKLICIHGTKVGAGGLTEFDITVDGNQGMYTDVNAALGEAYVKVERL